MSKPRECGHRYNQDFRCNLYVGHYGKHHKISSPFFWSDENTELPEEEKEKYVIVNTYVHDCDILTKYCEENCRKSFKVPIDILEKYSMG